MLGHKKAVDWEAASLLIAFVTLTIVAMVFLIAPTIIVLVTSLTSSEIVEVSASRPIVAMVLRAT